MAQTTDRFAGYRAGYARAWQNMTVTRRPAAEDIAERILANKQRYLALERATTVRWYVIGLIHNLECGLRFTRHLHNGDPLTARTRQVPAGRPPTGTPPFTFEESAIDALTYQGLTRIKTWSVERIAYTMETYNGFGYRSYDVQKAVPGIQSPYLWAGSNQYDHGKYVRDHDFRADAVSEQIGAMVVLKALMALDPTVKPPMESATATEKGGAAGTIVVGTATAGGMHWFGAHWGTVAMVLVIAAIAAAVVFYGVRAWRNRHQAQADAARVAVAARSVLVVEKTAAIAKTRTAKAKLAKADVHVALVPPPDTPPAQSWRDWLLEKFRGLRNFVLAGFTTFAGLFLAISDRLQALDWTQYVSKENAPLILIAIGLLVALLRLVTTQPVGVSEERT